MCERTQHMQHKELIQASQRLGWALLGLRVSGRQHFTSWSERVTSAWEPIRMSQRCVVRDGLKFSGSCMKQLVSAAQVLQKKKKKNPTHLSRLQRSPAEASASVTHWLLLYFAVALKIFVSVASLSNTAYFVWCCYIIRKCSIFFSPQKPLHKVTI